MAKKLVVFFLVLTCAFGLLSCQNAPGGAETSQPPVKGPDSSVPYSKGPDGPPNVKGPTAPPPGTPQAVTEKETGTYTLQ